MNSRGRYEANFLNHHTTINSLRRNIAKRTQLCCDKFKENGV